MSPTRWEQIHDALQAALEREPGERKTFLRDVGRADPELVHEVESLLGSVSGGLFDELVDRFVAPQPADQPLPARIGAYRPIRLLARGGMGSVYLAERTDGAYEQRVALKLLPAGTRADLHSRFLAERRILARLRHPNIARLLDGGTTDDGLPYLVLEYVDGEPLTTYCDRLRLSIDARLRLFLDVCAAVSYAHTNLIVHRDIKPANVLVVSDGANGKAEVKLLDFGIAKLLDDDQLAGPLPVTRADVRVMTPEYAAPEQVRGQTITTATDVYQLGVLLYELVSGYRPHRLSSHGLHHIEKVICDDEPARPSAALEHTPEAGPDTDNDAASVSQARASTPRRLQSRLRGDIDTIILHALAKHPERRYASVEAFATDVRNHLRGLPVHARPDTLPYRIGKFVRRNRVGVLVVCTLVLLLFAFAGSLVIQNTRIEAQRNRAERAADVVVRLFEDLEPVQARGRTVDAREILDRGTAQVTTELRDQPLLQARLFDVLGRVYQLRGYFAEAEPLLRSAVALRTAQLGRDDLQTAESRLSLASLLVETGRHDEAQPLLGSAASTYRLLLGPDDPRVAQFEIENALAIREAGDLLQADSILRAAVTVLRQGRAASRQSLADGLLYLGKVRVEQGDTETAEPLMREALDIREALFGREHPTVANALDGIGELLQARGDFVGAERAYDDALTIRRELFPEDHADIGVSLENLGIALYGQGRNSEAAALLRDALAIFESTFADTHGLVRIARAYLDSASMSGPRRH